MIQCISKFQSLQGDTSSINERMSSENFFQSLQGLRMDIAFLHE